jgi:hypothetical protein
MAEGPGPTAPSRPEARRAPVTAAQRLAGLVGTLLVALGSIGFAGGSSLHTGTRLEHGTFLGFAVNGWTNLVHLALGLLLVACAARRATTRAAWRLIALGELVAVVYGFVDGHDVFGLMPLDAGRHVLDCALLAIAIVGARAAKEARGVLERDRVAPGRAPGPAVVGPGSGHVGGPRRFAARIDARL